MSIRILSAFKYLLLISIGAALYKFIAQGFLASWSYKVEFFFNLDSSKWYIEYPIGALFIAFIGFLVLFYYYKYEQFYERIKKNGDMRFVENDINKIAALVYLIICLWFVNGNFINPNYYAISYFGDSTEYGTKSKKGTILEAKDGWALENALNPSHSRFKDDIYIDSDYYRFVIKKAAVFSGYEGSDEDKGFVGFFTCMLAHLIECVIYIFLCFTLPVAIFIVFREIEYKK
jgi:hypothetical protein